MKDRAISVAEAKSRLSEYLVISHQQEERIIITKRGKPFAAIIGMNDLENLKQIDEKSGLTEIIGKWKDFDDIAGDVEQLFESRSKDKGRDVPV
jgi:prevent-host-death family protein